MSLNSVLARHLRHSAPWLQLGTSDGRVKVVGQEGVEMSIVSPSPSGTKHLQFLAGRGAVLRVNLVQDVA